MPDHYAEQIIKQWGEDNRLRAASMANEPAFYRNLEQALDTRRQAQYFLNGKPRWDASVADFTTGDFLSLSRCGKLRDAFLEELHQNPDFEPGASGSRLQYGNYAYILETEREIAEFHDAETALIVNSTYAANLGVLSSVPLPGDAIVYDELVHASSHEGFRLSSAAHLLPFRHNDPDGLREVLSRLKTEHVDFGTGTQSILICVESIYSMDGDVAALEELVQVAKEVIHLGNAQFIMDEAHSAGVLGDRGRGLVSQLGLDKEIAIRIHATSKALGSVGGEPDPKCC
jgi:8-amino-7-oxononanoate synthase